MEPLCFLIGFLSIKISVLQTLCSPSGNKGTRCCDPRDEEAFAGCSSGRRILGCHHVPPRADTTRQRVLAAMLQNFLRFVEKLSNRNNEACCTSRHFRMPPDDYNWKLPGCEQIAMANNCFLPPKEQRNHSQELTDFLLLLLHLMETTETQLSGQRQLS